MAKSVPFIGIYLFVLVNARWFETMVYTTILLLVLSYSTTFASTVSTQDSGNDSIFDTVTNASIFVDIRIRISCSIFSEHCLRICFHPYLARLFFHW